MDKQILLSLAVFGGRKVVAKGGKNATPILIAHLRDAAIAHATGTIGVSPKQVHLATEAGSVKESARKIKTNFKIRVDADTRLTAGTKEVRAIARIDSLNNGLNEAKRSARNSLYKNNLVRRK